MQQNRQNYQKYLLDTIEAIKGKDKKPSLLLHVCCAPCSTACLEVLKDYFDITVLYYNPNIHPKEEFDKRFDELLSYIERSKKQIKSICPKYDANEFFDAVKGLEHEKEGGKRCEVCFNLRLEKTAQITKEKGFDYFTTTLTLSPYKNSELLNQIGKAVAEKYELNYLFSDFKKNDGYKKSIELSKEYNLYRQDYCGCIYSKMEREQQKKEQSQDNKCWNK